MRLLDLFCGAGGAAVGYHRAGFEVVGVDIKPQRRYPFDFVQCDALEYLAAHGSEFDVIHTSPPCQRYTQLTPTAHREKHPDLIAPVREMLQTIGRPYVIENVANARRLLRTPIMLCGSMFGLTVWRHRYFEVCPDILLLTPSCDHSFEPVLISGSPRRKTTGRAEPSTQARRDASGLHWMTRVEMDEAIPPAYTEYIGRQLVACLMNKIA